MKLLQKVYNLTENNGKNIAKLTEQVGVQNHRIDMLENKGHEEEGAKKEREKWEKIERDRQDKQSSNQWKLLGFCIAGAGVLSGAVFGVAQILIAVF